MKNEEHRGLWSSIQQFPLDDPQAAITFSSKLAAKQNWTPVFTERVVDEYRKFLFLCCISPNGASPSQTVDEAWHLHLTYTRSYWIDLCKNTLNKDIHHHPSRGGDEEDHKHHDWYAETLVLYESVFGTPPPEDIWPPPQNELQIPEPAGYIRSEIFALIAILLTLPLIVSAIQYNVLFPFALKGPQFLVFLPLLALSCIISYIILQVHKCRPLLQLTVEHFPTDATIYQTAQLLYGKHRAIQTAIIDLLRRNLIELTADKRFLVHKNRYHAVDKEQNPLIPGFLKESYDSINYEVIASDWYKEETTIHPALQKLYLLAYRKEPFLRKYHLLLVPVAVAIIRFMQGVYHGRPMSYLFMEVLAYYFVSYIVSTFFSRKRVILDKVEALTKENKGQNTMYDDYVVSNFALKGDNAIVWFAEGALLASIFAPYPILNHHKVTGDGSSFSSCSSCSGGGDGGGGGGCGGGGCGGCGGGCGS